MIPPSAQPPRTQTPPLGQVNMKTTVYCWLYLIFMHGKLRQVSSVGREREVSWHRAGDKNA